MSKREQLKNRIQDMNVLIEKTRVEYENVCQDMATADQALRRANNAVDEAMVRIRHLQDDLRGALENSPNICLDYIGRLENYTAGCLEEKKRLTELKELAGRQREDAYNELCQRLAVLKHYKEKKYSTLKKLRTEEQKIEMQQLDELWIQKKENNRGWTHY